MGQTSDFSAGECPLRIMRRNEWIIHEVKQVELNQVFLRHRRYPMFWISQSSEWGKSGFFLKLIIHESNKAAKRPC